MMEKLFIDCEFNGFGGKLMSMGIVAGSGPEFYEELKLPETYPIEQWVQDNVVPHFYKDAVSWKEFQAKLQLYLLQFPDGFTMIADWPDDLRYFCEAIITGPGLMMGIPSFKMEMGRHLSAYESAVPHNALEDARAIMKSYRAA